ncbi:MAG: DNRLRE domain-containing protein [Acidimicrobiales bacterium]
MIGRGRIWRRVSATLLLPCAAGFILSGQAAGDSGATQVTTTVLLTQSTYFWREQETNVGGSGVSPPSPVTDPTVPNGDVAVAGPEANGQPDKETYLEFDVSAIPAGSTVTSFVVTLPVDSSGQNFTPTATAPPIIACLPQNSWSGNTGGQSFSGKPADTCATNAPKFTSNDGGKTYTADIASLAQSWIDGINTGVAVADDPSNTSTAYQVVFGPAASITQLTASITYTPPSSTVSVTTTTILGGGGGGGGGGSSISIPNIVVPVSPGSSGVTGSNAPTATSTTAPAPASSGSTRALGHYALAGDAPPVGFWLFGLLLVAVLIAASLVLGDEPTEDVERSERSRRRLVLASYRHAAAGSDSGTGPSNIPGGIT